MTRMVCPACGHESMRPAPPDRILEMKERYSSLTLNEAILVAALQDAPHSLRRDWIYDRIWGDDPNGGPDDPRKHLDVLISKLRRKGFDIQTLWGFGYRLISMAPEDRA